jgi:hypothetical protein
MTPLLILCALVALFTYDPDLGVICALVGGVALLANAGTEAWRRRV